MIDFEKEFQTYLAGWMKKEGLSTSQYAVVDDHLDEIYDEWMETPLEAFGGKTPSSFFDELDKPFSVIKLLKKYVQADMSVPGPLLNRMVVLKESLYPLLLEEIAKAKDHIHKQDKLLSIYVELISEMQKGQPLNIFIDIIENAKAQATSVEMMIDVLKTNVTEVKKAVIAAYLDTQHEYAKDSFLDILSELMGDADAYKYILENFMFEIAKCGMYAHMLSKLGNPACLDALEQRLSDQSINYINFCRVKEALEELGGETTVERDFSGDNDFEYMSHLKDENDSDALQQEEDFDG